MRQYPKAAEGLKLMFYGEVLTIVSIVLLLVPTLSVLLTLAGGIVSMVGLYRAGEDDTGYRTAFELTIAKVVLNLLGLFTDGVLASLVSLCGSVAALLTVYFVCITTARILRAVGEETLAARGRTVWMINLVCTVVGGVIGLAAYIPLLNVLAVLAAVLMAVVELVGYILYMMFLYGSCRAL